MKNIHNLTRYSLRQIKSAVFSRRTRLQLKAIVFSQRYNCHLDVPSLKNRVNVFEYHPDKVGYNRSLGPYNLGDSLGLVIVDYLLSNRGLKRDAPVKGRKHLFTVGSNIFGGEYIGNYQNATIWGSGILKEPSPRLSFLQRLSHRHLDIRAVRGPLTREVLLRFGHNCPEVYGDPAILMPMIYSPSDTTKKNDFIVIPQFYNECIFRDEHPDLPMVSMNTNDYQSVIPDKHKKDLKVTSLPDSLSKAIYSFIIAGAIRNIRGQGKKHHSMLVHVTRFVDVQMQLVELLKSVRKEIVNQLDFKTGPQYETLINVIKDLWENDFLPTTNSVIKSLKDPLIRDCTWEEIEPKLYEIASKIEIKAVNGKAADGGLNYDDYPDGYFVIAVGGDKLSRGLTLSGLTVSYYARLSQAYDTLLQMGRWFGYRDGYADVCRLYTSSKLNEWYRHIAVANEELRNELDDMAELGATPESYGLKVRTHPDGMLITALNKMRNSENRQVTFAGKLAQTTRFYKENNCNQRNIHFVKEWIAKLGTPELPNIQTRNNYLWKDIDPELVLEFLKNISVHPTCSNASPKILSDYISSQNEDGELISWSVALVSSKQGTHFSYGNGIEIGLSWRTDDVSNRRSENDTIYLIRNNLITESDQDVDLTQKQKDEALRRTIDKWTPERTNKLPKAPSPMYIRQCREKTNGLLLIYTFESGLLDEKGEKGKVYPDKYLGYAISFPASDTAKPIEYKVDEVYLRNATDE